MTKEKTFPQSIRLTQRYIAALEQYRQRKEQEARKVFSPDFEVTNSHALRLLVEGALNDLGLVTPEAPEAAPTPAPTSNGTIDQQTAYAGIEADLIAGNYTTQKALAEKYGRDQAVVSRLKKALKIKGAFNNDN